MKRDDFCNASDKVRLINFKVFETNLAKLFDYLEDRGFEPILIKGWAAARFYPKPWSRKPGDVDLSFRIGQTEKALDALKKFDILPVDVHRELRHLDAVAFSNLFRNSELADCGGKKIRVLRVEDHLRVLCVHWLNDGGVNKERLWDIFYAIESNRENFDWDRCLGVVSPRRRLWIETVIVAANLYLGLEIEDLPLNKNLLENSKWIRQTIEGEWMSGVRLIPLENCIGNNRMLFQQITKRIPPNPLQAIIELEKDLDAPFVFRYQLLNIFTRLAHSADRVFANKR